MAMLYYYEVQKIMGQLSESYITGTIEQSLEHLENLRTKVSIKTTKEEDKELDEMFKKIKNRLNPQITESNPLSKTKARELIRETERKIVKLMHSYKMIFPNISTVKGFKKLEDKYNLEATK